jgi:hypothetical protein
MAVERRNGYWLWVGGPVPPGSSGITLGPLVSVRTRAASNRHLLRHELIHVEQFRRHGFVGFLRRYVTDYLRLRLRGYNHRNAYLRIPFEIEAEWKARTRPYSLDPAFSLASGDHTDGG